MDLRLKKDSAPAQNVLNMLAVTCHEMSRSKGFYELEDKILAAFPEAAPLLCGHKLALIHSEASEVLEALRKKEPQVSAKIAPHSEEADECADILIRLLDYCGYRNIDIGGAVVSKMLYNSERPYKHGKTM